MRCTLAYQKSPEAIDALWKHCGDKIFSHASSELRLGIGTSGVSSYYSSNISLDDIKTVQEYGFLCFHL